MAKARKRFDSLAPSLRSKLSQLPEDDAERFVNEGEQWTRNCSAIMISENGSQPHRSLYKADKLLLG